MAYMEGKFNDIMRGDSTVRFYFSIEVIETRTSMVVQGGHNTGKTGNLDVDFSRQGKHTEFSQFNFLHRKNFEILEIFGNFVIKVATR